MRIPLYDYAAVGLTAILLVGVLVLVGCGVAVPDYLETALTMSVGIVLRGGVGAANDYMHRNSE